MTGKEKMYRSGLAPYKGRRHIFTGIIESFGVARDIRRPAGMFPTILLREITNGVGAVVADHAWIHAEGYNLDGLLAGDELTFEAQVEIYKRGYRERKMNGSGNIQKGYRFSEVIIHGRKR